MALNKLTIFSYERPTDFDIVCSMVVELRRLSDNARSAVDFREGIEALMAQVQAHYLANVDPLRLSKK